MIFLNIQNFLQATTSRGDSIIGSARRIEQRQETFGKVRMSGDLSLSHRYKLACQFWWCSS